MPCNACPFNDGWNEEATIAQNYGCLPTALDMIDLFQKTGLAMSCHNNDRRACSGLCNHIPESRRATVYPYSQWYQNGPPNVPEQR